MKNKIKDNNTLVLLIYTFRNKVQKFFHTNTNVICCLNIGTMYVMGYYTESTCINDTYHRKISYSFSMQSTDLAFLLIIAFYV